MAFVRKSAGYLDIAVFGKLYLDKSGIHSVMVAHWLVAVSRFIDSGGCSVQIFSLPPVHNKDVR